MNCQYFFQWHNQRIDVGISAQLINMCDVYLSICFVVSQPIICNLIGCSSYFSLAEECFAKWTWFHKTICVHMNAFLEASKSTNSFYASWNTRGVNLKINEKPHLEMHCFNAIWWWIISGGQSYSFRHFKHFPGFYGVSGLQAFRQNLSIQTK